MLEVVLESFTGAIGIQRTERRHQSGTGEKGSHDGQTQPPDVVLQAPAVDELGSGYDEEEGDEAAVESVLGYALASSLSDLFGHGHV